MTLFLPSIILKTFLVVLIFFISLALVGKRLLKVLSTRYVSGKSDSRLFLSRVFLLYFCKLVPLETL